MSSKMDIETDAAAEGAVGGSVPKPHQPGQLSATTRIDFETSDGSKFLVQTSGAPPNMQVGSNNVMHVVDNAVITSAGFIGGSRKVKKNISNTLPLLTSKEVPGNAAMDIIARNIGKDWKALGRRLGLDDGELDNIKIDHYAEGQYEVSYQMIRKWKELAYPTELCKLAKACNKIGRGDISDKLAKSYTEN